MKNTNKVSKIPVFGLTAVIAAITLTALFALSTTACYNSSGGSSGGGGKSINSTTELMTYLDKQPANSPGKPIKIAMKANGAMIENIVKVLNETGKYVSLDLSDSTLTNISRRAFGGCKMLAGIIIPQSVTSIENEAFWNCSNLISVTFQGTITANRFHSFAFPAGPDLRGKYLAGGIGTYTRSDVDSWIWTKK
jgi:hypothetical protein